MKEQDRQIQAAYRRGMATTALWLLFNTVVCMGLLLTLPVVVPLVMTSHKRRKTVRQRLGWWCYPWQAARQEKGCARIWVHALSVGEVRAAQPLVERIKDQHPGLQIFFTASTLTGFQTASRIFAGWPISLAYFPYDFIWSVRSVADRISALAVILVETDVWPNFLAEMKRRRIPVYLVNLRVSDSAWKSYRRLKWVFTKLFGALEKICVQTPWDARRLIALGISPERVSVTGNIKIDGAVLKTDESDGVDWRNKLKAASDRRIIVAGSTHEGEERLLLDAFSLIKNRCNAVSLILAPRDPNRAQAVQALCEHKGLVADRLSQVTANSASRWPDVIVVDFIGVLNQLYSLSSVAFVGGSLVREGGHNPLEPAVFGCPIVFGPDMSDFRQIAAWLLESGGARQVNDQKQLTAVLSQLLDDPELATSMGDQAKQVVLAHQGAVERTLASLDLDSL